MMKEKRQLVFRDSLRCIYSVIKDMNQEDINRHGKEMWVLIRLDKYEENLTKHNSRKNQSAKCGCDCHTYHIDKKHCKCKKRCKSEAD